MAVSHRTPGRKHQMCVSDALLALRGDRGERTASALTADNVRVASRQCEDISRVMRALGHRAVGSTQLSTPDR